MEISLKSPSGKLDLEIFKEKEQGYYDYKITNHGNNITCFVYGQPLENVYEVIKNLDSINFAQWVNGVDCNSKPGAAKLNLTEIEDAIQQYLDGTSVLNIAKKYGVSTGAIYHYIQEDERTKNLRSDYSITKKQEIEIFELHQLGFNPEDIAAEMGITEFNVKHRLKNPRFLTEDELEKFKKITK